MTKEGYINKKFSIDLMMYTADVHGFEMDVLKKK